MNNWSGMMTHACDLIGFLRDCKGSAWLNFSAHVTCAPGTEEENAGQCALMVNRTPTARYYGLSHFTRYIRPGARQIASTTSDPGVMVAAFRHEANDCFTLVLVNKDTTAKTVNGIGGAGVPGSLEKITSTETVKTQRDTVVAAGPIELPPRSIVTLVAGAYRSTGSIAVIPGPDTRRQPRAGALGGAAPASVSAHGLDGRQIARFGYARWASGRGLQPGALAPGVCALIYRDSRGLVLRRETLLHR
jgi:hypothetical protein